MRKVIISLAAAGAALVVASPASAQYFPQPQGYAYGYNNNHGQVRALQARVDSLQWQIKRLDKRNMIRDRSADRLIEDSRNIERRLRNAARYGLNPYEANDIQMRLARLEQRVQFAMSRRYNGGHGYYDRDGRDHDDRRDRRDRRDRDRYDD